MNTSNHSERRSQLHTLALILIIILFLWPAVAYADPGPGNIAGTITNTGGTTVPSAFVCAFDYYTHSLIDCDLSDIDGNYVIPGLPASDYRVEVSHPGYAFEMYDDYHYGNINSATPVTVYDDTTTSGIDFILEPGGDVSGTVYESDGVTPIEDVSVMIVFPDGSTRGNCTDASGNYTIARVIHGVPLVVQAESVLNYCSGGPENFFTEYWEEAPVEAAATPITLSAGMPNASGIDFTLDDGADTSGRIFGFVTDAATGDPISNAYVCAFDFNTYSLIDCEPSGTDGSYLISGLPPSDYRVEVSAAGYAYEMYDGLHFGSLSSATPVTVYQTMTTGPIDFELEPGGEISGTVYESDGITPVQDVSVMVIFPDGSSHGICTDATGHYSLRALLQGIPLKVYAFTVDNYCGRPENLFTEYWEEVPLESLATEITLSAGSPVVSGIDFTLDEIVDSYGRIFGFVTDEATGDPIPGATVCVFNFNTLMQEGCVTSNADGSYLTPGLPALDYRLEVHAPGYAFEMYDDVLYGPVDAATIVSVYFNTTMGPINFELAPGGDISGTVYESDGVTPIEDISVEIIYPDGSIRGSCTDASGHYSSEVYTLPYGVPVRVKAYAVGNFCGGPENFFTEYWEEVPLEGLATEITLSAGTPNAPGTDFTLDDGADTGGQIFGFVTDEATGDPVPDARVCAYDFDNTIPQGCTNGDADGFYLISGLPASDYRVEVHADGYAFEMYDDLQYGFHSSATRVTVDQGMPTGGIDFELEPGGNISGTVYESDGVTPIEDVIVMVLFPDGSGHGRCTDASGYYTSEFFAPPYGVPLLVKAYTPVGNGCGGPENFFTEYWQEVPLEGLATEITLSAGTPNASGIDFTLDAGADTGGQIFGYVTDEATGDPIPGARLCAHNYDDPLVPWDCVDSGADGSYLFSGLTAADYRVEVFADGYAFEMYDDVLYGPVNVATTRVTVYQGLITDGIDFELEPGGNVSGTVYESDGVTPIEDIAVEIIYPDGSFRGSCTDASGHYSSEVFTLPYGVPVLVKAYAVGNFCGGPEDFFTEYWEEAEVEGDATPITLSAGAPNAPGTDFTLTQFVYTPVGTGVVINPDPDVAITFDEVTSPGGTSVEAIPGGYPLPPDGFRFMGTYFEIRSEAEFTTAQVCFTYDDSSLTPFEEASLLLYHYEGGAWVNVTDPGYPDVDKNMLCGTVSEFSPFGLMVSLNQPPVCEAAYPSLELLWPVNHNFVPINVLGVTDPDGDPITITIDSIFQDEAVYGRGSGNTAPDGQGVGTSTAYVRAERSGDGNGRYYHISFTADDGRGGTCSGVVLVGVPRNLGPKGAPVDDGALYDSTVTPSFTKLYWRWAHRIHRFFVFQWMRWHW